MHLVNPSSKILDKFIQRHMLRRRLQARVVRAKPDEEKLDGGHLAVPLRNRRKALNENEHCPRSSKMKQHRLRQRPVRPSPYCSPKILDSARLASSHRHLRQIDSMVAHTDTRDSRARCAPVPSNPGSQAPCVIESPKNITTSWTLAAI